MKVIEENNTKYWFDEELLKEPVQKVFDPNYWRTQGRIIGRAEGRGTTWFVQTDTLAAALRHYRRGGLFGKLVKDQYWFSGWEQTRCYQEFQLLHTLIDAGVNVPRPIAARAVKTGLYYRADLITEKVYNARDLVAMLEEGPLPSEMYQKIGQEIRKMHDAQVNHTDLNIHNILIDDSNDVWLIDFDKCHQQNGNDWKQANYDRLKRSFEKEVERKGIHYRTDNFMHIQDLV
ncbi:3-deoxy-D-manno-octulosonic acid kinase [Vibrio maritimus]|uniref:3-deoxy-D-manno-octulosonic acid kinase n=1 Tax=Vibrio maritimus TaxID=990268 RepID=A0A090SRS0_9VIBR|nr:3-deoxy-D-manno-octulosonic acid kinase [Vibrio maritimus]